VTGTSSTAERARATTASRGKHLMSPSLTSVDDISISRSSTGTSASRIPDVPADPPRLLRRPAVEGLIRAGADRRLLLVTAPAGHGKTTSAAAALRDSATLVWVTLDPSDRDPSRLQRRVIEALGAVGGRPVPAGTALADLDDALTSCCRQLGAMVEAVVLVIDDEADALQNRGAARRVERILDRLPDGFHTVVLARRKPPIGIERRRARGELAEVAASQLTFSDAEVATYLGEVWNLELDDHTLREVAEVADGWPVVLETLAARLTSDRERPATGADALGPGALPRLLLRELIDSLPAGDRRFLVDISVLAEFDVARCERLTEQTVVAERLLRLHAAGLIVAPDGSGVFRHRPLVRELLTEELHRLPCRRSALHAVVAAMHRDAGSWTEAVHHSIEAGDIDLALGWAESHLDELLHVHGGGWVRDVFARVPTTSLAGRPRLSSTGIDLAVLNGDRASLEATLAVVENLAAETTDDAAMLRRVRAALSRLRGDGVEPLASGGRATLEPIQAHPLGVALAAEGRHEAAYACLRCALDDAQSRRDVLREQMVLADLAWHRASAGYLIDADLLVRRATAAAAARGSAVPPAPALIAAAQVALDRGRTAIAYRDALQARSAASLGWDLAARADAGLLVSRSRWALGDTAGAIRAVDDVERELAGHAPGGGLIARVTRAKASLRLALDDVEGAVACDLSFGTGIVDDLPPEDRVIAAHVHLKLGDPRRARAIVGTLRNDGIGPRLKVQALRIEASACNRLGEDLEAERIRRGAERIARSAGLFAPAPLQPPTRPRYALEDVIERPRQDSARPGSDDLIEELTGRELEVLHRLASSTNVEIAADLYVSVNTVKTHLKSIYRKLGVTSRDAAVHEARRYSLV
jgi:LuxR family transcriptional regulator, maltose regulon positive regulatory protein